MEQTTDTEAMAWDVLHGVIDPEVGINIVDLGLVYGITADDDNVRVTMTLTTPGCPLHETIAEAVDTSLRYFISDIETVTVDLVWEPSWSPALITAAGREALGWR